MAIKNQIQFRRGSSDDWIAISGGDGPALYEGEPGFDITNNILKIGDGSTNWKDLRPIGADQNLYKVKNTSGGIIHKGQVVSANGTVGNSDAIQVRLFIADGSIPEYTIMGLATQTLDNNDFGYVTAFGIVKGIDTDPDNLSTNICAAGENWLDGDILYASPTASGKLTKNKPQHDTILAIVLNSNNNGSLFARPTWNPHLDDVHDVNTSGVTNNQYLIYNSGTQLWTPTSSGIFGSLSVDSASNINLSTYSDNIKVSKNNINHYSYFVNIETYGSKILTEDNVLILTEDNTSILREDNTSSKLYVVPSGSFWQYDLKLNIVENTSNLSSFFNIKGSLKNINEVVLVGAQTKNSTKEDGMENVDLNILALNNSLEIRLIAPSDSLLSSGGVLEIIEFQQE